MKLVRVACAICFRTTIHVFGAQDFDLAPNVQEMKRVGFSSSQRSPSLEGNFAEIVDGIREVDVTFINVIRSVAGIMNALARGDYSRRLHLHHPIGELLDLQVTVNATIEILGERWQEVSNSTICVP